jgi:hypothetical protein
MSNNQVVIETLTSKRKQLLVDQERVYHEYQKQINEIEDALDALAGKNVWRTQSVEAYDDESPNAITGSEDGI